MKTLGAAMAVIAAVALAGCQAGLAPGEVGSGTSATEERAVAGFSAVRVSAAAIVEISIGALVAVRVTADDNLLDNVRTQVVGERLDVGLTGGVQTRTPILVTVTMPSLTAIEASSAGQARVAGLAGGTLTVGGDSSGRIEVTGVVEDLDVRAGSAARLELAGLEATRADVQLDSAAVARLHVLDSVGGSVSSAAVLMLAGAPDTVDVSTSSAGVVRTE